MKLLILGNARSVKFANCILKEVHLNLLLGAGGFIEIVGSYYILLVNPPLQESLSMGASHFCKYLRRAKHSGS